MGSAGCVFGKFGGDPVKSSTPTTTPEQVESVNFSITGQGADEPTPPAIAVAPSENQIRITGTLWGGNPCHETHVESLRYDGQADELRVLVAVKKVRSECPDSTGTDTYELVIRMNEAFPKTVTATHTDAEGKSETTNESPR